MDYYKLFLYIILSILLSMPICLVKSFVHNKDFNIIILTIIIYCLIIYLYCTILIDSNISILAPITGICPTIIMVIIAIFFFEESISINNFIGLLLSIVSIYFLSMN